MIGYSEMKMVPLRLSAMLVLIGCISITAKAGDDAVEGRAAKRQTSAATAESATAKTDVSETESRKQKTISILALHQFKKGKIFLHSFDGKVYEVADTNGRGKSLGRMPQPSCLFLTVVMLKEKPNGGLVNIVGPWGNSSSGNKEHERLAKKYEERIRKIEASVPIH